MPKNLEHHIVYKEGEIHTPHNVEKTVMDIRIDANTVTIHYTDNSFMEVTHDQTDGFELWIPK